jgi:cell division protein FtsA
MREQSSQYFVGLDVGTSAVRCIVGSVDPASEEPLVSIIGHGSAPNSGMRKGLVTHLEEVAGAVNQAIIEAERIAGVRIQDITVNVNGAHVSGLDSRGVIAISAANREITLDDKLRAEEAATIIQIPSNREIIQVFPKNYSVDGHDSIKDPIGMHGVRLEVDTHIVTAAIPNLKSLDAVLEKVNVRPTHHTVAGLAAAEAVLNRRQKEAGTLVLDIGASTTNLAVIEDGEVQHVAVIPMGGINITNDLAIGLKVDLEIAEDVKLKHASVSAHGKKGKVSVQHDSRNHVFDAEEVTMIVEARIEEIFEYVDKELKKIHKARKLPGGVVLTGGTANIPGIASLAKEKLEISARVGKAHSLSGIVEDVQDPSYITAIGLMELDMLFSEQLFSAQQSGNRSGSLLSGLNSFWQKFKS